MTNRPRAGAAALLLACCSALGAVTLQDESWTTADDHWIFVDDLRDGEQPVLDMSWLNQPDIDPNGFISATPDGDFIRPDGTPIRFWAIGSGIWNRVVRDMGGWWQSQDSTQEDIDQHLQHLSRLGVNMVRIHTSIFDNSEGAALEDVDAERVDRIQRFVASCRHYGIYVTLQPYFPIDIDIPESWDLAGYSGSKTSPWGLIFFNERLRSAYKIWMRELLTRPNPYRDDGTPLAEDPGLAILQVLNEDGLFFYTSQSIRSEQQPLLLQKWNDWLVAKYGSLQEAIDAWGGQAGPSNADWPDDDLAGGMLSLHIVWFLTGDYDATGATAERLADQTQFFAELQRRHYDDVRTYLKDDLGCGQLINASNWRGADEILLNDQERWSYDGCDVIAKNRYTSTYHTGSSKKGWLIAEEDHFHNQSALLEPLTLPTNLKQVAGKPMIVTETQWVHPRLYQSEGVLLGAAYQSMNGVDALYWFATGNIRWDATPQQYWQEGLVKWNVDAPAHMAGFPGAALLYRRGDVARAATVVHEERSLDNLWRRSSPLIAESATWDPIRDGGDLPADSSVGTAVDGLAFLTGRVEVVYGGDPAASTVADLTPYIDEAAGTVTSTTGELVLDHDDGLFLVDTPRAQGAAGFFQERGQVVQTGDLRIHSNDHYATVLAIALDARPLATSDRVLLQVVTTARPEGFQASWDSSVEPAALHIDDTGADRWAIRRSDCHLEIANTGLDTATRVDPNGYADGSVTIAPEGTRYVSLTMPADAFYVILEDSSPESDTRSIGVSAPGSAGASISGSREDT
ncbi:MAG: hypothetical protein ACOCXJ_08885, partial [Planctomycetota bacterium]